MPKVGGKHFPYTKAGVAAAMKAQREKKAQAYQKSRGSQSGMGGQYRSPTSPPRRPPVLHKNLPMRGTPPRVRKKNPYPESDR